MHPMPTRKKKHRIARRKARTVRRWSDTAMLDLIREAAATVGEPLTFPAFELWAVEAGKVTPAERTWTTRFGSWTRACETAGIEPLRSNWDGKPGTYTTVDQCLDAVRDYVTECETEQVPPTLSRYEQVSKDRGWPARNTLYVRVAPTWTEILDRIGVVAPTVSERCVSYTPEEIDECVIAAFADGVITMRDYTNWRNAQPDPEAVPSVGRVASHYDGWKNLRSLLDEAVV